MQSCLSSPRSIISFLPIARSDFFYWELTQFCVKTCSSSGWWQSDTYCSNPELLPSANQTYPFISLDRNELAESKDVEIVLKVLKSCFARSNRLNNAFEIGLDQMLQFLLRIDRIAAVSTSVNQLMPIFFPLYDIAGGERISDHSLYRENPRWTSFHFPFIPWEKQLAGSSSVIGFDLLNQIVVVQRTISAHQLSENVARSSV